MKTAKYNIFHWGIIVFLLLLIFIRLFLPDGAYSWINLINYLGLLIAFVSLIFDICNSCNHSNKFFSLVTISIILFTILVIIGALIFTNILTPSSKTNDFIMLLTLLISLPSQFYIQLINFYLKK